ncbi:MAG: VOC family protein [Peptoniphilaceae bacterium]|nr:VOC family protein [Peptoniphilaceae bacterium]MDY6018865.1 VOC family protein [Anaerococcus sp.]
MKFTPIHVCIRVFDLEKSINFYREAFDFVVTRKKDYPDDKFTLVYMASEAGDFELELTYNYNHEPYTLGDGYSHIAFEVSDLEKSYQDHKEKGFKVSDLSGLSDDKIPNYYFITDPDGYDIEILRK